MGSQYNWKTKLYGDMGFMKAQVDLINKAAFESGEDMKIFLEEQGIEFNDANADCHCITILAVAYLPEELWKKSEDFASRCFVNGCHMEKDHMEVSYYGPTPNEEFFEFLKENCSHITRAELKA